MPILTKIESGQLERDTSSLTNSPQGEALAVEQLREFVADIQEENKVSEKDAKLIVAGMIADASATKGATYEEVMKSYPAVMRNYIGYTADDLKTNQTITIAGTAVSAAMWLAYILIGFTAAGRATKIAAPFIAKIASILKLGKGYSNLGGISQAFAVAVAPAIAKLGISMTAVSAIGNGLSMAVNNWNDVFHWGPQMGASNLKDVLKDINTAGSKSQNSFGAGGVGTPAEPRQTKTTGTKFKIYVGTLAGGRVAEGLPFAPIIDDEITDTADLMNDVMMNLTAWLQKAPSQMTWEIQIKLAPYDSFGVRRQGYWLSLSLYYTSRWAKRLFLEEILLGPVDPVKYPVLDRESISVTTPLLSGGTMATDQTQIVASGRIAATDNEGNVVEVLPASATSPSKTEPVTPSSVQSPTSPTSGATQNTGAPKTAMEQSLGVASGTIMIVDNARGAVNLRDEPNITSKIWRELPNGTEVTVQSFDGTADGYRWSYVNIPSLRTAGYVAFDFLKVQGSSQLWAAKEPSNNISSVASRSPLTSVSPAVTSPQAGVMYKVNTPNSTLSLRTSPTTSAPSVAKLSHGTLVEPTGSANTADGYHWLRVSVPSIGADGYVASEFLTPSTGQSGAW